MAHLFGLIPYQLSHAKSIEAQQFIVGHIANAMARARNRDLESAMRIYDLMFSDGLAPRDDFIKVCPRGRCIYVY